MLEENFFSIAILILALFRSRQVISNVNEIFIEDVGHTVEVNSRRFGNNSRFSYSKRCNHMQYKA